MQERVDFDACYKLVEYLKPFSKEQRIDKLMELEKSIGEDKLKKTLDAATFSWKSMNKATGNDRNETYFPGYSEVLILGGRGSGKSTYAINVVKSRANKETHKGKGYIGVGATTQDIKKIMVSDLLSAYPQWYRPTYHEHNQRIVFPEGIYMDLYPSEAPEKTRGQNSNFVWIDDMAAFHPNVVDELWKNLKGCNRVVKGFTNPCQIIISSTPKSYRLFKKLYTDSREPNSKVKVINLAIKDNLANLSETFLQELERSLAHDSKGYREEVLGEIVFDSEGLVFSREWIRTKPVQNQDYHTVCIGIDPAITFGQKSDSTGIVITGKGESLYVLEDLSLKSSPDRWANIVKSKYEYYRSINKNTKIAIEVNQGGDVWRTLFNNLGGINPQDIIEVRSTKSKGARASATANLYARNITEKTDIVVHNKNANLNALEDQMIYFDPDNKQNDVDDRLDANMISLDYLKTMSNTTINSFYIPRKLA